MCNLKSNSTNIKNIRIVHVNINNLEIISFSIFLVFNVHGDVLKWESLLKNIEKYYSKIENVEIIGIDAFNS